MKQYNALVGLLIVGTVTSTNTVGAEPTQWKHRVNHCAVCLEPSPFSKPFSTSLYNVSPEPKTPAVNFSPWFIPRSIMGQDANPLNAVPNLPGSHYASNNPNMLNAYF